MKRKMYELVRRDYCKEGNKLVDIYVEINNGRHSNELILTKDAIGLYKNINGNPLSYEQIERMEILTFIKVVRI